MAEYIEREAATNVACNILWKMNNLSMNNLSTSVMTKALNSIPAADVAPVRHGRWLHTEEPLGWQDVDCMECSACHDSWIIGEDYCFDDMPLWNYCPSCGAKMNGGRDQ